MEYSKSFIASLRRTAQNEYPLYKEINKIEGKIKDLEERKEFLQSQIDAFDKPIVNVTGKTALDLVGRTTKDGKSYYVLRYPDTIIPPEEDDAVVPNAEQEDNIPDYIEFDK